MGSNSESNRVRTSKYSKLARQRSTTSQRVSKKSKRRTLREAAPGEQEALLNLWRWKCGLPEVSLLSERKKSLEELRITQWNPKFEKYMRNRLIMGGIRYHPFDDSRQMQWNFMQGLYKSIGQYEVTGNTEFLVDCANYCLLEFTFGTHPKKHWHANDDGIHNEKKG